LISWSICGCNTAAYAGSPVADADPEPAAPPELDVAAAVADGLPEDAGAEPDDAAAVDESAVDEPVVDEVVEAP
jgi:hypothetical protein